MAEGGALFRLAPEQGAAWFAQHGWQPREFRGSMLEAARLKGTPSFGWFHGFLGFLTKREAREQWARVGFVLFERS